MEQALLFAQIFESDAPPISSVDALGLLAPIEKALLEDMQGGLRATNAGCAAAEEAGGGVSALAHSNLLCSSIQTCLQKRFEKDERVAVLDGLGVRFRISDLFVAVKKMTNGWFSLNDTEKAVADFRQANGTFLVVGYSLDSTRSEIRNVRLVLPRNELKSWWDVPLASDMKIEAAEFQETKKPRRGRNRIRGKGEKRSVPESDSGTE